MDTENVNYYCLYCKSGSEDFIEKILQEYGHKIVNAMTERKKKNAEIERRRLLSGYVLFYCKNEPEWFKIEQIKSVYRVLYYDDNTRALKEKDKVFIKWIHENGGIIKASKVRMEGTKVKVIEGPLKNYEGSIVKVNKRQNVVKIQVNSDGIIRETWVSVEYVE
jgi:transcriptional antiterminator NusG